MNEGDLSAGGSSDFHLHIDRKFNAPPDKVFAAWTNPELMAAWFGPHDMTVPEIELDLRVGGDWRLVMEHTEGGRRIVGGTYREIDPPRCLTFTWAWRTDGTPGNESLVEIEFEADGDGTMMYFHHSGFESENASNLHVGGWTSGLECLEKFIAEGKLT